MSEQAHRARFSRRHLFRGAAGVSVAGIGAGIGWGVAQGAAEIPTAGTQIEPFHGIHQAGVITSEQAHAQFVGLDLISARPSVSELAGVLRMWSQDAALLAAGKPALADTEPEIAGTPARLTVTIGLGASIFAKTGIVDRTPTWLHPLPDFAIDRLDPVWGQTDLLLQICAEDPLTVAHAVRVLVKNVRTKVRVRWSQRGFRHARDSLPAGTTMRNLMGSVDGTVNPRSESQFDDLVWADGTDQAWMKGGTSLVLRRIAMDLDGWEELDRHGRELTIGRTVATGAPLSGDAEHDEPDFAAVRNGLPVIPGGSHIARAAHPDRSRREQFLRRGYNYDDPPAPGTTSNSGLIFTAYQRDVDEQFLPVQQRLAEHDALNEWTTPIGSAVYAIPPGALDDRDYVGRTLIESTGPITGDHVTTN